MAGNIRRHDDPGDTEYSLARSVRTAPPAGGRPSDGPELRQRALELAVEATAGERSAQVVDLAAGFEAFLRTGARGAPRGDWVEYRDGKVVYQGQWYRLVPVTGVDDITDLGGQQ